MSTLSSVPEELRLKVKLKLLFNDLPIDSETEIALFEATERIINQQIKSVLDELEGEAEAFERTSKERDGLTHFAVPLSTIQKIRSRYD